MNPLPQRDHSSRFSLRRAKAAWARRRKKQDDYTLEIAVTAGLFITGIFVSYSSLANSSKFSLAVLFGVFETVFIFSRIITRRIDALARDYLTVIPRDVLSTVLYQHLDLQRATLLKRAKRLADHHLCELEKHEMYAELIGLTEIVREVYAGGQKGKIWAISSVNIEDFDDEPLAEAYLDATRRAVQEEVTVCRLFLLDQRQAKDRQVAALLRKHEEALGGDSASADAGVKWLSKVNLQRADQFQDFALFADDALVAQNMSGDLAELGFDEVKVNRARETFQRLWTDEGTQRIEDLPLGRV
jgi:hypothetical protein